MEAESGSEPMVPLNTLFLFLHSWTHYLFEGQPRGLLLPGSNFRSCPIR